MHGTILANRYLVAEEIGIGGMGSVYRATDLRTGGVVAVKVPHAYLTGDAEYVLRLRREAQIAGLMNSSRVVRVLDLDTHDGQPFLVMEYVHGETLAEHLRDRRRLPLREVLQIAVQVGQALEAAHARGIVHRDLKPQNIKLIDGEIKVLDFGIARAEGLTRMTAAGLMLGTPEYCAPERGDGLGDIRADIYSLGVIIFEMHEGHLPFQAPTPLQVMAKQEQEPAPPLTGSVPASVQALLSRCLAKWPEDRYQSPSDLVRALHALLRPLMTPEREADAVAATVPLPAVAEAPTMQRRSARAASGGSAPAAFSAPPRTAAAGGAMAAASATWPATAGPAALRTLALPAAAGAEAVTLPPPPVSASQDGATRSWQRLAAGGVAAVVVIVGALAVIGWQRGTETTVQKEAAAEEVVGEPPVSVVAERQDSDSLRNGINVEAVSGTAEREAARAVNGANAAIARALRTGDAGSLTEYLTGEALATYNRFVETLHGGGRHALAELVSTEVQSIRPLSPTAMEVRTRERWTYDEVTKGTGERVVGTGNDTIADEVYTVVREEDRWRVRELVLTTVSTERR